MGTGNTFSVVFLGPKLASVFFWVILVFNIHNSQLSQIWGYVDLDTHLKSKNKYMGGCVLKAPKDKI